MDLLRIKEEGRASHFNAKEGIRPQWCCLVVAVEDERH